MTHFIGIISAKGGVGKTSISINLASAFSRFNKSTILIDGDIVKPNLGIILGENSPTASLHDSLLGDKHITESIIKHKSGISLVTGNLSFGQMDQFSLESLNYVLRELVGLYQIILVDSGSGISIYNESVIRSMDHLILVTGTDLTSLTDSLKTLNIAKRHGKKILGTIINRFSPDDSGRIPNIESFLESKVIGCIPYDPIMARMEDTNLPVVESHPESEIAMSFKRIAAGILNIEFSSVPGSIIPGDDKDESLLSYFLKKFGLR